MDAEVEVELELDVQLDVQLDLEGKTKANRPDSSEKDPT